MVARIIYTTLAALLLVGVVIVAFVMKGKWNLFSVGFADVGVYGAVIFLFLIMQQIFALSNNKLWIPKLNKLAEETRRTPLTNIQVVGYREDPKLFRSCLTSLTKQDYENIGQIVVGIDGNDEKDLKMEEAFEEVFPHDSRYIRLDKVYNEMNE